MSSIADRIRKIIVDQLGVDPATVVDDANLLTISVLIPSKSFRSSWKSKRNSAWKFPIPPQTPS